MRRVHFAIFAAFALSSGLPGAAAHAADAAANPEGSAAPVAVPNEGNVTSGPEQKIAGVVLPPDAQLPRLENSWRGIFGVRADGTHASSGHSSAAAGAMFALGFDGFGSVGTGIARVSVEGALGGGGAGFEGDLGLGLFAGKRWDLVDRGGPFVRLGGEGRLTGNDLLYDSRLIVPELEAGFQVLKSPNVVDAALYAGPMLDGRATIGDDSRRLGSALAYGARFAIRQGAGYFGIDAGLTTASHGFSDQALSVVGRGCIAIFPTSICLDARAVHADEAENGAKPSETAGQLGVSFGLGL